MSFDAKNHSFRGVLCLYCKEPIPIPAIVRTLETANGGPEPTLEKSRVFNIRCAACHKEKPYRTSEIQTFEGSPDPAMRPVRPASVRWFPGEELVKVAKA